MAPVGLPLLLGTRRRVFQQRKQKVQSFPGRNELGLFRKSPEWLDEREGAWHRYGPTEVGSGYIT